MKFNFKKTMSEFGEFHFIAMLHTIQNQLAVKMKTACRIQILLPLIILTCHFELRLLNYNSLVDPLRRPKLGEICILRFRNDRDFACV